MAEEQYTRQLGIYDPSKYNPQVTIVGAGGIGGPTTLALAKLGVKRIKVYDSDRVEEHNQPNQMFGRRDIGRYKVHALADAVEPIGDVVLDYIDRKFNKRSAVGDVLISAVDSMDARRMIFNRWLETDSRWLIDGRIGEEVIRVYTVDAEDASAVAQYDATLIPQAMVPTARCTHAAVIDVMFTVAALITRAFRLAMTGEKPEFQVIHDQRNLYTIKG